MDDQITFHTLPGQGNDRGKVLTMDADFLHTFDETGHNLFGMTREEVEIYDNEPDPIAEMISKVFYHGAVTPEEIQKDL